MRDVIFTVNKFANSFDTKDWNGLQSILADKVHCDYRSLRGVEETLSADDYVAKRIEALDHLTTHHMMANHQVTISNGKATCVASSVIWRNDGDQIFNTHAVYHFELKRDSKLWKIYSIKQDVLWNEGEKSIHSGAKK